MSRNDLDRRRRTYEMLVSLIGTERALELTISGVTAAYSYLESAGYWWDRDNARWERTRRSMHSASLLTFQYVTVSCVVRDADERHIVETWCALAALDDYTMPAAARIEQADRLGYVRVIMRFRKEVSNG